MHHDEAVSIMLTYWGTEFSSQWVPFRDHIDQGTKILSWLGANNDTIVAFTLHGMFQSDSALSTAIADGLHRKLPAPVLLLVMEYRNKANAWLRTGPNNWRVSEPPTIPLPEVRQMLIADKVQNMVNAQLHYQHREDYQDIMSYFDAWFKHLSFTDIDTAIKICTSIE